MTKEIPLTQGKFALVDDDMFEYLNQWKWFAYQGKYGKWYARRNEGKRPFRRIIHMHRVVSNTSDGMETDHRDGDGLNNQRYNLRDSTHSQNIANITKRSDNTSGYKGVHWHKHRKKWASQIRVAGKKISLGYYDSAEEAARAYDRAALKYFGPYAVLNFQE